MLYTAVIVEPRHHPAMKFVLNNFLENLDYRWSFIVFHGTENKKWLEDIVCNNPRIQLNDLGVSNLTLSEYNSFIASARFIEQIPTETFLIFQTDTMISSLNKNLIYDFMEYDYVGAPWFRIKGVVDEISGKVGNGGLSLRKKSKMLEVVRNVPYPNDMPEDQYYCVHNKTIPLHMPTYEKAQLFAIETVYSPRSFGLHKAWLYLQIPEEQFPGYNELVRLNSPLTVTRPKRKGFF